MSPVGDQKLCPICDSPLAEGSRKCGFCGTDLSIFEEDLGPPSVPPASPAPSPPPAAPPPAAPPPSAPAPAAAPPARPPAGPAAPPKVEELATFQCPECGATVDADASSCPSCGVGFAEPEGEAQFQCPDCGTIVDAAAVTCPGCGAVFAEAEEEAAPEGAVEAEAKEAEEGATAPESLAELPAAPAEEKRGFFARLSFRRKGKEEPEEELPAPAPTPGRPAGPVLAPAPSRAAPPLRPPAPAGPAPPSAAPEAPRDLGRELARLVAEVKPLMALARDQAIEVTEGKELIDRAVLAGRDKQLDQAIELVTQARSVLSASFREHLSRRAGELEGEIGVARRLGADVAMATRYISELRRASAEGDFQGSLAFEDRIRSELQPHTGRYKESGQRIAELQSLIADAEVVYVDTTSARKLLTDANHAFGRMDYDAAGALTTKGTESIVGALPARVEDELRKGKELLVEAKMRGAKISGPITTLKAATRSLKASRYIDALREIKQFKQEVRAL